MAGVGREKGSPAQIEVTEKQRKALEMRKAGASYAKIAEKLRYANRSGAFHAVMSAMDKTLREPAEDVREIELTRLDEMHSILWEKMLYTSDSEVVDIQGLTAIMAQLLRIGDRRSRLLGLDRKDAPIVVENFPPINTADDAVKAISILIDRASSGKLALSDAIGMATLVNKQFETLEGIELLERLKRLEEQHETELKQFEKARVGFGASGGYSEGSQ